MLFRSDLAGGPYGLAQWLTFEDLPVESDREISGHVVDNRPQRADAG